MSKIVGIDFGDKRMGLALSDDRQIIAFPTTTVLAAKTPELTIGLLLIFLKDQKYESFVIGLPLHMNGKDSEMSLKVRHFAKLLEETTGKKVILWDERLTSKQVEKSLIERDVKRKNRTQFVDSMAAALILQNYLDSKSGM